MDRARWEELVGLAARQHGVVGRTDLDRLGHDRFGIRRLVEGRRLVQAAPNAFVLPGSTPSWEQRSLVAMHDLGGVLSRRTSGALWGFDAIRPTAMIDVDLRRGRDLRRSGVRIHRVRDLESVQRGPFVVTPPVRTLLDLAGAVSPGRLEHAVDSALRDRLVTLVEVVAGFEGWHRRGRKGSAAMGRLLEQRTEGVPESVLERRFLRLLAAAGLPTPELQVVHGERMRVDAQFTAARIVVELDGQRWHATPQQFQDDRERDGRLQLDGWIVLHFTWRYVTRRPGYVVARLREALRRAA